jgi:hypothetical protein
MSIRNSDTETTRIARKIRGAFNHVISSEIKDIQVMADARTFDYLVAVQRKSDGGRAVLRIPLVQAEQWTFELSQEDTARLILFLQ